MSEFTKILAFAGREPPREIQLWDAGDNPTDYGIHKFTARSAELLSSEYATRGNPLLVDIEHGGATDDDGHPRATAGYAKLEIRDGAPWLSFDWSDVGREQIATGQRRYLSPEYDVDKKTGEITRLVRVALVAEPGTHHARLLASRSEILVQAIRQGKTMAFSPEMHAALQAAFDSEDPKKAWKSLSKHLAEAEEMARATTAAAEPPPVATTAAATAASSDGEGDEEARKKAAADKEEEEKKKKDGEEEAARKAAASGVVAGSVAASAPTVAAVTAVKDPEVARDLDTLKRDSLLRDHGDKIKDTHIRTWCSSQPFGIVKGIIDALPKGVTPPARVEAFADKHAREGNSSGMRFESNEGLKGAELEEFHKRYRTGRGADDRRNGPIGPHRLPNGNLRVSGTVWEWQAAKRVEAARRAQSGNVNGAK
jgi:hypothetical protein